MTPTEEALSRFIAEWIGTESQCSNYPTESMYRAIADMGFDSAASASRFMNHVFSLRVSDVRDEGPAFFSRMVSEWSECLDGTRRRQRSGRDWKDIAIKWEDEA